MSIIHKEQTQQTKIFREGITQYISVKTNEYHTCRECGYDCYLSGIICNSHPGQVACLHHATQLCECPVSQKRLLVRVHLSEIKEIFDELGKIS